MGRFFSISKALVTLGVLLAVTAFGCSQSEEEGGQTSRDRTTATQAATTVQKEETAGEAAGGESTTQRIQDAQSGGQEETTQGQPSQQQRQQAQEQAQKQQQQAEQQRQQAQQQQQQSQQEQQGQQPQQQDQQQQDRQQTVTVRITGTEGLSFAGRVGSAQNLRRVEGSVPQEYELPFRGAAVNASIRKQQPGEGTLGVEVVRSGEVVASRETSSTPGVLNVVWTPQR